MHLTEIQNLDSSVDTNHLTHYVKVALELKIHYRQKVEYTFQSLAALSPKMRIINLVFNRQKT